jgi:hypothetical protein
VHQLKNYLSAIALEIDAAVKQHQGSEIITCSALMNPMENASFTVENPVERHLRLYLKYGEEKPKRFTNASLVYYTYLVVQVLDYLMNSKESWAYSDPQSHLYRDIHTELTVDKGLKDSEAIFMREMDRLIRIRQNKKTEAKLESPEGGK